MFKYTLVCNNYSINNAGNEEVLVCLVIKNLNRPIITLPLYNLPIIGVYKLQRYLTNELMLEYKPCKKN